LPGDVRSLVVGAATALLALTLAIPLLVAPRRLTSIPLFGLFLGGIVVAGLSRTDVAFLAGWGLSAFGAWGLGRLDGRSRAAVAFPLGAAGLFGTTLLVGAVALRQPDLATLGGASMTTTLATVGGLLAATGLVAPLAGRPTTAHLDVIPAILVGPAALTIGLWPAVRLGSQAAPDVLILCSGVFGAAWLLAACRRPDVWSQLADLTLGALCIELAGLAVGAQSTESLAVVVATGEAVCLASLALALGEIARRSGSPDVASLGGYAAESPLLALAAGAASLLLVGNLAVLGSALVPAAASPAREAVAFGLVLPAIIAAFSLGSLFEGVFGGEPRARLVPRASRLAGLLLTLLLVVTGVGLVAYPRLLLASLALGG
jgi:hypothetical protein